MTFERQDGDLRIVEQRQSGVDLAKYLLGQFPDTVMQTGRWPHKSTETIENPIRKVHTSPQRFSSFEDLQFFYDLKSSTPRFVTAVGVDAEKGRRHLYINDQEVLSGTYARIDTYSRHLEDENGNHTLGVFAITQTGELNYGYSLFRIAGGKATLLLKNQDFLQYKDTFDSNAWFIDRNSNLQSIIVAKPDGTLVTILDGLDSSNIDHKLVLSEKSGEQVFGRNIIYGSRNNNLDGFIAVVDFEGNVEMELSLDKKPIQPGLVNILRVAKQEEDDSYKILWLNRRAVDVQYPDSPGYFLNDEQIAEEDSIVYFDPKLEKVYSLSASKRNSGISVKLNNEVIFEKEGLTPENRNYNFEHLSTGILVLHFLDIQDKFFSYVVTPSGNTLLGPFAIRPIVHLSQDKILLDSMDYIHKEPESGIESGTKSVHRTVTVYFDPETDKTSDILPSSLPEPPDSQPSLPENPHRILNLQKLAEPQSVIRQ